MCEIIRSKRGSSWNIHIFFLSQVATCRWCLHLQNMTEFWQRLLILRSNIFKNSTQCSKHEYQQHVATLLNSLTQQLLTSSLPHFSPSCRIPNDLLFPAIDLIEISTKRARKQTTVRIKDLDNLSLIKLAYGGYVIGSSWFLLLSQLRTSKI